MPPNRSVRRLAVALAIAVLSSGGWLFAAYQNRLPERERWIRLLSLNEWGFGRDEHAYLASLAVVDTSSRAGEVIPPQRFRAGFLSIRVERRLRHTGTLVWFDGFRITPGTNAQTNRGN